MTKRNTAFFLSGGAGRMLSAVPALELYEQENPDDDFVIVCEGTWEMFRGHPLQKRCTGPDLPHLFTEKIKDRNCVTTEPYRVWEYYNQECSLRQAFDIQINNKGVRDVPVPNFYLSSDEDVKGYHAVKEGKEKTGKEKAIVLQPFGRSSQNIKGFVYDGGGRSLDIMDTIELVKKLKKDFCVFIMSEHKMSSDENETWKGVGQPDNIDLRGWAGIINNCDHLVGIDSAGQHIATSLGISTTVLFGSTYPINTSYPDNSNVKIIDFDKEKREYSPIRIAHDDTIERQNDKCLKFEDKYRDINEIVKAIKTKLGVKK
tara:strand:- start:3059 stop:4006 length:948 start_codon:yes stop_codon:yes gene_type:complete